MVSFQYNTAFCFALMSEVPKNINGEWMGSEGEKEKERERERSEWNDHFTSLNIYIGILLISLQSFRGRSALDLCLIAHAIMYSLQQMILYPEKI